MKEDRFKVIVFDMQMEYTMICVAKTLHDDGGMRRHARNFLRLYRLAETSGIEDIVMEKVREVLMK